MGRDDSGMTEIRKKEDSAPVEMTMVCKRRGRKKKMYR
jgi:hypothetical protein